MKTEVGPIALADAGVAVLDCEHKTPTATAEGIPYIAIPDIQDGRVVLEATRKISESDFEEWTRRTRPQSADVIVTRRGRVGDTAPIPDGIRCAIGQNLVLLRSTGSEVDQQFLRWAVRSPQWWSEVDRLMNVGAVFSSLNVRDIGKIRLNIPSVPVQRGIVDVLSALDDKIAANTKLATKASELAGHVFDAAIGGLGSLPMSDVLNPVLGGTPARSIDEYWDGAALWASAKDVTGADFGVILDTQEKVTDLAGNKTKAKPLPPGSVVLTARGTVGAVARLARPSAFNQSCYGFAPDALPAGILYFSILRAAEKAKSIAHGSVFDTITMRTFQHLDIPDFAGSALSIEAEINPLLSTVTQKVFENIQLATARDALLPQLMSGKLRVKDAEKLVEAAV